MCVWGGADLKMLIFSKAITRMERIGNEYIRGTAAGQLRRRRRWVQQGKDAEDGGQERRFSDVLKEDMVLVVNTTEADAEERKKSVCFQRGCFDSS